MSYPKFNRLKYKTFGERLQIIVLGLAYVFDGLVNVITLGEFDSGLRIWLLFEIFGEE